MPCSLHLAQDLGIRLIWVVSLPGLWLGGPAQTNTCVQCQNSWPSHVDTIIVFSA